MRRVSIYWARPENNVGFAWAFSIPCRTRRLPRWFKRWQNRRRTCTWRFGKPLPIVWPDGSHRRDRPGLDECQRSRRQRARIVARTPGCPGGAGTSARADVWAISVRDLGAHPFVHRSSCELDAVGCAQLKAAGVTLRVTVRAEREERAFRLIRNGKGMTLAPRSLVPDDRVACAGVGVERGENDRGLNGARSWIQCCMALSPMRWRTWCR